MFLPDDNNVALPHAGLLSYFRHSEEPAQTARNATPSWSDTKHGIVDEETQSEFWDSESACSTNTDCEALCQPTHRHYPGIFHTLYDFWGSICLVAIAACAALLGLDIALGQFGMGIGVTDCIIGRHLPMVPTPPVAHELHFCLATPNREAPGPQIWRIMSSRPHNDCTTEMITLLVGLSEKWKLRSDDEIVIADEHRSKSDRLHIGKFLGSDSALARKDLGDNIAEEGVLSQSGTEAYGGGAVVI